MKTKPMSIFWSLYMLFFAVPFPMLIYYNTKNPHARYPEVTDTFHYVLLCVSVLLWLYLINWLFNFLIRKKFEAKKQIEKLMMKGTRVESRVEKSVLLKTTKEGFNQLQLTFSLKNFEGEQIAETLQIVDTKPYERRYEQGNRIYLLIDPALNSLPYLTLDGSKPKYDKEKIRLSVLIFVLITAAALGYYYYAWQTEGASQHWNFLTYFHPLIFIPGFIILVKVLLKNVLGRLLGGNVFKKLRIKYYGLRTMATTINAAQTGVYINRQPQVKFELEYSDATGQIRRTSFKKVISLLDMATVKQPSMDIFYEKANPENIALASEIMN